MTPREPVAAPSIDEIKASMRATWMAGDFGMLARRNIADAEAFVRRLALPPGTRVLDVACGTGNLAIPLARSGAVVTGIDIAPNLLLQARERASSEGLPIVFDEGDAEELPYDDGSFDAAVSMFGAMFAPRPRLVAAELGRVLRPGGRLAMANWNPESFSARMFSVAGRHLPPPPGLPPPVLWGDATIVRERLAKDFTAIETEIVELTFDMPTDPAGAVDFFRRYFGPTQVAFSRLDERGQAALAAELEALWAGANRAVDPSGHTLVHNQYLQVTAIRR